MDGFQGIAENDVIYRCIGDDFDCGVLSCGFMRKRTADRSQYRFRIGYYSLIIVLEGSGCYISSGGERFPIQAGDMVQRLPGSVHSTEINPDGRWLEFYISVGYPVYEMMRALGMVQTDAFVRPLAHSRQMFQEFTALQAAMRQAEEQQLPDVLLLTQDLLFRLHRSIPSVDNDPQADAVEAARRLIGSVFDIRYDVRKASGAVGLGYESFRKQFRQKVGISPGQYHKSVVMKQAGMMLQSGIPVKQVALSLGYSDVYSFSKQFKKLYGQPPARYSKTSGKENTR